MIGDIAGGFGSYRDGYELYSKAASKDKNLFVVKGASHYDLYDQPESVAQALEKNYSVLSKTSLSQILESFSIGGELSK